MKKKGSLPSQERCPTVKETVEIKSSQNEDVIFGSIVTTESVILAVDASSPTRLLISTILIWFILISDCFWPSRLRLNGGGLDAQILVGPRKVVST